jgi:glycosyltransferase involved in cell wall biosynthesis
MSWFPALTETFILREMQELERLGMQVEIFPLLGRSTTVLHPGAAALVGRTRYHRFLSWELVEANLGWLRRRPGAYARAWWKALAGNWRSPGFFLRALYVVPKAAVLAREMEALGVGHMHAHWATHPTLAALVIRELTGISYSFTGHAHDLYVDRTMLREKMEEAEFVVTISRYNRELLRLCYGEALAGKVEVVRCGVDPQVYRPRGQGRGGGVFTLLCVAGLRDYKGHPYLVEACERLRARGLGFRCLLVGEGPERRRIEALIAKAGLGEQVVLLGAQPADRVRELLGEADVVVLPSVTTGSGMKEGIPLALMEGLACEVPVVTTDISGVAELVENGRTGLLVPERDGEALAKAIERLMEEPELGRRLGRAGRERVLEEFDLRRNAARLKGLLARQLEPRREEGEPLVWASPSPAAG